MQPAFPRGSWDFCEPPPLAFSPLTLPGLRVAQGLPSLRNPEEGVVVVVRDSDTKLPFSPTPPPVEADQASCPLPVAQR